MASLTQWTWEWSNSGRRQRTGKPGVLQSMGSQRVKHSLATEQQEEETPDNKVSLLLLFWGECAGSSLQWSAGTSLVVAQAPEHEGSVVTLDELSYPTAYGILILQPGIEPTSPALEGGFLTTGLSGKSLSCPPLFIYLTCTQRRRNGTTHKPVPTHKLREEITEWSLTCWHSGTLILDFPTSRTVRNFCCQSPFLLWQPKQTNAI